MKLTVVGVGPAGDSMITLAGQRAVESATLLIGSKRQLRMFCGHTAKTVEINGRTSEIIACVEANKNERIVILASGDPLLFGIGKGIRERYEKVEIISGISSLQYIFTKIPVDMNEVFFTSTHGRRLDFESLKIHQKIAMVTDKVNHPGIIAKAFLGEPVTVYIGTDLGYESESVVMGKPEEFCEFKKEGMHVVVIHYER
ncbi:MULTISPECIES: precorrin-6y C5,15-methyltransferase (decarboxylating) subunit CbiE [unclassified Fusibacter]|uniref:precorrin-6y C5,15-methyltransferase (decarboxylating) subunit CbiE n=1 Tax=unclassified Fusibacter TaxID=2624464 RepID=UPI0010115A8F|nr:MULTISPECIES: precorrin-6y C5,15-methyltransferase (decarboxylating) subunit CbiE [unclassified Fusibacter]MCK8060507.1 precorrin-6y C5,15-methyltransferase (decarboxylating) subunit CbiE [Fusibacter sp. A2]NPE20204.1 precorrin-6y C5,15-methyltransferase (decarboxylating) subunit CbiE [Fusibacter sp. A1]RXV63413.1 precorrin-6y C5,15-methyltransferase (decarboxylating) subunit CbiE [Fusibacter sp. A1]